MSEELVYAEKYGRLASESFGNLARYLHSIPAEEWEGPTGCAKWSVRDLAGHVLGEAVWFSNLVRGVTSDEQPFPGELYESPKRLAPGEMSQSLEEAAQNLQASMDATDEQQLLQKVDLKFTELPLWRATYVSADEGVVHSWDARAKRERPAAIRKDWAVPIARGMDEFATFLMSGQRAADLNAEFLLLVEDGIGPVMVTAGEGRVSVKQGAADQADATLYLTSDQYVRLMWGRLGLEEEEGRTVRIEGSRERAVELNRIFGGV